MSHLTVQAETAIELVTDVNPEGQATNAPVLPVVSLAAGDETPTTASPAPEILTLLCVPLGELI